MSSGWNSLVLGPTVILVLVLVGAFAIASEVRRAERVRRLREATYADAPARPVARGALFSAAVASVALALVVGARLPGVGVVGGAPEAEWPDTGARPVLLALDVSRSMAVRDGAPDRASEAGFAARALLTALPSTPVGLVVFAEQAILLLEPTLDHALLHGALDALAVTMPSGRGSDPSQAIDLAIDLVRSGVVHAGVAPVSSHHDEGSAIGAGSTAETPLALVLLSDGEEVAVQGRREGSVSAVGRWAREDGVVVHAVLVGTAEGGPVPGMDGGWSRATPGVLQGITQGGGGVLVHAGEVERLTRLLAPSERRPVEASLPDAVVERVPAPGPASALAGVALALLLVEMYLGSRGREIR